ncbi:MAG: DEAD/DEAH box helicase [Metamycoplasmataceae bacterium]
MKYKDIKINEDIKKSLEEMGFSDLSPIQEQAIGNYLENKEQDIIAQAQTGTGKTAAFAIPILNEIEKDSKDIEALIIAPTRELASQILAQIEKIGKYLNYDYALILGGSEYEKQFKALSKKPKVVVGTPGRINDLINNGKLKVHNIKFFVLDEADELLKIGFKKEIEEIIKSLPKRRINYFYTATFDKKTMALADIMTSGAKTIQISEGLTTSTTIEQFYVLTNERYKLNDLIKFLRFYDTKSAIIFGRTKRRVDQLCEALNQADFKSYAIQGNMLQNDRNVVMNRFRENGGGILIATDVVSRGIDIDHVDWVINFDLPQEIEYYTHRIGRVGRAGRAGKSLSFVKNEEIEHLNEIREKTNSKIEKLNLPNDEELHTKWLEKLNQKHHDIVNKQKNEQNEESVNHLEKELAEGFSKEELAIILTSYILEQKKLKSNFKLSPEPAVVLKGAARVRSIKNRVNGASGDRNRGGGRRSSFSSGGERRSSSSYNRDRSNGERREGDRPSYNRDGGNSRSFSNNGGERRSSYNRDRPNGGERREGDRPSYNREGGARRSDSSARGPKRDNYSEKRKSY